MQRSPATVFIASLGLFVAAASTHAQVQSTWTNDGGDNQWTNAENWDHDQPSAKGNYPDNGRGGFNYDAVIGIAASVMLNENVTIDGLSLSGFNRFVTGGSTLEVLDSFEVEGLAGFQGSGLFRAPADVEVFSGEFRIDGWRFEGSDISIGSPSSSATVSLINGADLNVIRLFALSGGVLSSDHSSTATVNTIIAGVESQITLTTVAAPLTMTGGTLSVTGNGEMRFRPVFGFPQDEPLLRFVSSTVLFGIDGGLVRFDQVRLAADRLSVSQGSGVVADFKDSYVELSDRISGDGLATLTGMNAVIDGGAIEIFGQPDPTTTGFVQDGGVLRNVNNLGVWYWRSGTVTSQVRNDSVKASTLAPGGTRLVTLGTFINDGIFAHNDGTFSLGDQGIVQNAGLWKAQFGATALNEQLPAGLHGFVNTDTFERINPHPGAFRYVVSAPFSNQGEVICGEGELLFRPNTVAEFDYSTGELTGGTWTVTGDGILVFEGLGDDLIIADDGAIAVDGPNAEVEPLERLTEVRGELVISGGKEQLIRPADGELEIFGGVGISDSPTRMGLGEEARLIFEHGSELRGNGEVDAPDILSQGFIRPGLSPGILTIDGNYSQLDGGGELEIELAGGTPGDLHDQLVVTGDANLGGTLRLIAIDGYFPPLGAKFTVLTGGAVAGRFDRIVTENFPPGLGARLTYRPDAVVVTVARLPQAVPAGG
ncbi:MAG: hypothetical protein ACF8PN_12040 [Phycisphaerales bacterium]